MRNRYRDRWQLQLILEAQVESIYTCLIPDRKRFEVGFLGVIINKIAKEIANAKSGLAKSWT
jgi:hypothetical protein